MKNLKKDINNLYEDLEALVIEYDDIITSTTTVSVDVDCKDVKKHATLIILYDIVDESEVEPW